MRNKERARLPINQPTEFHKLSKEKQRILIEWCNYDLKPYEIKTKSNLVSSYELKHIFERTNFYITNGMMKGALNKCGFQAYNQHEINWVYALSKKVTTLDPLK